MTLTEKVHLFHGSGSGHIGNVEAQRNGAIPALKLNDGPQGFRCKYCTHGTTTAWPAALHISATWSTATAEAWGKAMGKEFFDKGANVQLGPGMCVARVPRNGRNFEYLSGEDPVLGATLVPHVVEGIQSQHVIANAKHFVNNNQETNRKGVSANVDERTEFEIYYPPFEAAAKARVGSIMCSYNKIKLDNGHSRWPCENHDSLARDLKERLGFEGWVMSDWGATHSMSILQGLDQEMPGSKYMSDDAIMRAVGHGAVPLPAINDSARRILVPMFEMGLFDEVWRSNNGSLEANVTSAEHNALARSFAAEGMVLLQNEGGVLPLTRALGWKFTLAIVGAQASDPMVSGAGSGHVRSYYKSAPLQALMARLNISNISSNCEPRVVTTASAPVCSGSIPHSSDCYRTSAGAQISAQQWTSMADCCDACANITAPVPCATWLKKGGKCRLLTAAAKKTSGPDCISGTSTPPPAPPPGPPPRTAALQRQRCLCRLRRRQ